jgi:hypothetical protein
MNDPTITYVQHSNTTPQNELSVFAAAYRIILESQGKRDRHLDKDGPNDGTTTKERSANESSLYD